MATETSAELTLGRYTLSALLLGLFLAFSTPLGAAEIRHFAIELEEGQVLFSLRLEGAFHAKLLERVESGLPTTLIYELELSRDRKRWFDRNIGESTLTVVGIYDAVRREYLVNYKLDGRLLESRMVHDLAELEEAMTVVKRLPAFSAEGLEGNQRLVAWARAELGSTNLLGFIPRRLTTDWAESNKVRPPFESPP